MNEIVQQKKTAKPSIDRLASFFLPEKILTQILLWVFLPSLLLFLTIGLSFVHLSSVTFYLPLIAIVTLFLTACYRTIGFYLSFAGLACFFLIFYHEIPPEQRLWQLEMIFSIAIDCFVVLLAVEEIESLLGDLEHRSHTTQKEMHSLVQIQLKEKKSWEENTDDLEADIERWKEEAEQRRIEKSSDEKRLILMHSEIELLTSQKEELISDAFEARNLAAERLRRLEEQLQDNKEHVAPMSDGCEVEVNREINRVEGLYKQLSVQFEEKSKALVLARKELFQAQGKLLVQDLEQKTCEIDPDFSDISRLQRDFNRLAHEYSWMEEEITQLESLVFHILSR